MRALHRAGAFRPSVTGNPSTVSRTANLGAVDAVAQRDVDGEFIPHRHRSARSGKSSVARLVADASPRSALIEGDAFFAFLANGAFAPWLPESQEQNTVVTRTAGRASGEFARGGFTTVYDGVVGPWFLDVFANAAGLAVLDYVVLLPPVEVCQHRVATRHGHGFTDQDATVQMHRQFTLTDIADQHVNTDPHATATEIAATIRAAQQRGELRYTVP